MGKKIAAELARLGADDFANAKRCLSGLGDVIGQLKEAVESKSHTALLLCLANAEKVSLKAGTIL